VLVSLPTVDPAAVQRRTILRGIAFLIGGDFIFAVMEGLVKWLSAGYPTLQIAFCRSLGALVVALLLAASGPGLASLRTRRLGGQLWRSTFGFASLVGFFYAYGAMPLADAIAIGFAAPIFMTALSIWLLGERVGLHRWSAVIIGFAGVLVMVRPGQGPLGGPAMIALAATFLYALAMIQVRKLSPTESAGTIVFYFSLFSTFASGLAMPVVWVAPDWQDALLLAGVGVLGGLGQLGLTQAFRLAPVSVVAPFDYIMIVWGTAIGWYVWGDLPDGATIVGAVIVVASGIYILQREARRSPAAKLSDQPLKRSR
jgi:drug/metabolite transporter (DMT)-like permease